MLFLVEALMVQDDLEGYSSTDVCEATGLRRTTLDAWLLRRYLDLSPGPGTGQERRFTIDEVVLIAITADLTKLGLTVGAAAHAANMLPGLAADGHRPPVYDEDGWTLVIGPSPAPAGIDAPTLSPLAIIKLVKPGDLQLYVQMDLGNTPAVVTADISVIARRTADRLKDAVRKKKGRPRKGGGVSTGAPTGPTE
jgi:hypothetical protein